MKKSVVLLILISTISFIFFNLLLSCKEKNEEVVELNIDSLVIYLEPFANSANSFKIQSNTSWSITTSENWLQINPTSGINDATITVTVTANNDSLPRTANIIITAKGKSSVTVMVIQKGVVNIPVEYIELDAVNNITTTFTFNSNHSWLINNIPNWISCNPMSGNGSAVISITAQENTEITSRTATIVISENGVNACFIVITQKGKTYFLNISRKEIVFPPEANTGDTITIYSNTNWKIKGIPEWISISSDSGINTKLVTITAQALLKGTPRTARLSISGSNTKTINLNIVQNGIPCIASDETPCYENSCGTVNIPTYANLPFDNYLPDPFTFLNGTRMSSKAEWACRRNELAILAQEFEFGYKPCTPYEATKGSFNNNIITVSVLGENGKTISFNCPIIYPSTGIPPYPAVIGIGFSFLNNTELLNLGVAIISFPNNEIAEQNSTSSRGKGKFYDLYCSKHSAGALMAWAWGVSRLIDAIEKTPEANINPKRLAVTGCSRNGKGALVAGAFDERIILTIPQESGSGGAASWRVSDAQRKAGQNVQTLSQIVTENCWFRENFSQFSSTATKLPFDHHSIIALCAPRAILVIENTWMEWLGNLSTWVTANTAHMVWQALGYPDRMGFSQVGHSNHCSYPTVQLPELTAFIKKFLLDSESENTYIMKTDGNLPFDTTKWINWTIPTLQ